MRIYTTRYCGYCRMARGLLEAKSIPFEEIDVTNDPQARDRLYEETGRDTVPQVFIHGRGIGGYTELRALADRGELEPLLHRGAKT